MTLPNEMIVKICKNLKTPDLLRISEASSKVYQVCRKEVEKREKEYQEEIRRERYTLGAIGQQFFRGKKVETYPTASKQLPYLQTYSENY